MIADQLPTGRRGQVLAVAIALVSSSLLWLGLIGPTIGSFHSRNVHLRERQTLLRHMQAVTSAVPRLKAAAANSGEEVGSDTDGAVLLAGATDAVAAADLQERVQKMARMAGADLSAVTTLPTTPVGLWHKVPLRISLTAPWPVLMDLLLSIEQSQTRIFIDDVHFHSPAIVNHPTMLPI